MSARATICALTLFAFQPASAEDITMTRDMLSGSGNGVFDATGLVLPDLSTQPLLLPGRKEPSARLLRFLGARGAVNGHKGILYDNRDRGHSALPDGAYPSLARVRYGPELQDLDFGLAWQIRYPAVVIGNSSTAVTSGPRPRSLPRLAMTTPGLPRQIYSQYINNHLYLYPEHRDHDDVDLFPASWPMTLTTQGSSGSDKPFLHALLMSLAAMPPDTVTFLKDNGLVAPTLQMLLRRNLVGVESEASYLSPAAHPTVFSAESLRMERMIGHAGSLTPDQVAPMVRLSVERDDFLQAAGLSGQSELLYDTPVAIARLWRGFEGRKQMVLSAADTVDPLGRDLGFRWVLLRGDPRKVRIEQSSDTASAEITVDWHDRHTHLGPAGPISTARVDIGVFAVAGGAASAPSILSISFPSHQKRLYTTGFDGAPILNLIDYDAVSRGDAYDPALFWTAPWSDEFVRDGEGTTTGLVRTDAAGTRSVPLGEAGPNYRIEGAQGSLPTLVEVPR